MEAALWEAAARRASLLAIALLPLLALNVPFNLGAYYADAITHPPAYYVTAIASTSFTFLALLAALALRHRAPRLFVGVITAILFAASALHGALAAWVPNDIVLYVLGMMVIATVLTTPPRLAWPGYAASFLMLWLLLRLYDTDSTGQFDLMTNAFTGMPIALVTHVLLYRSLFGRVLAEQRGARANTELSDALDQLRAAQAQLVEAERQAERARISRDLHDHVGAQVTHMIAEIEEARLAGAAPAAALDRLDADARATLAQLREMVWALDSAGVTVEGLAERLRQHARRLRSLRATVTVEGDATRLLQPARALHLHRIAQEALTNAAKHSGGTRAEVRLVVEADRLRLTVQDDGTFTKPGSETQAPANQIEAAPPEPSGYGIASMRSRAEELGGTFVLDRGTSVRGTSVRVTVPLARAAASAE